VRLVVTTPTSIVEDISGIRHIRAEDETGAFGILSGHADFVTVLPVSVVTWSSSDKEGFVLVRGGVLSVTNGDLVEIAARGAYRRDELENLDTVALEELKRADESEDITRKADTRLYLAAMRQVEHVLRAGRKSQSAPPLLKSWRDSEAPGDEAS
jgi:F-type H+-transporting ATPase subunit epsilon